MLAAKVPSRFGSQRNMQVLVPGCTCGLHSRPLAANRRALQLLKSCALSQRKLSDGPPKYEIHPVHARLAELTLCIAAICDQGKSIVAVSDLQISSEEPTADGQAKRAAMIAANWWVMCSAADVQTPTPLITSVRDKLWGQKRTAQEVAAALSSAYGQQVKREAQDRYMIRSLMND